MNNVKKGSKLQRIIFNWAINLGEKYKRAELILNNAIPLFDRADYNPEEKAQAKKTVKKIGLEIPLS